MIGSVLIIDDSAVDRSIMSMIIRKNIPDVQVFESEDGIGIKELIRSHDIKVCILDLRMPIKDGYSLLSEIKSDPLTMDVPVIVCTGVIDTTSLERVLTLGAYDYFSKPLSEEAMKISLPLKVRNAIELMKRTKHIVHISQIDALTGLYNRSHFKVRLSAIEASEGMDISILMCDINGLKISNDAYGNEVGDAFLVSAAEIIQSHCPESSICSRWGGDEFAVCLLDVSKQAAETMALKIKQSFSVISHNGLTLSMACGWDTLKTSGQDLNKILVNAEDAMFRDKILEDVSVRSSMIGTILNTLHEKNPREEAHSRRVSELCQRMGEVLCLSDKEVHELRVMGLLHDIGKIAIDEHILNKPGHLNPEEWLEMKRHPEIGYRLLSSSSEMKIYADAILCHHERVDGKGYPNGLVGEDIPIHSKILSIIDSFDAMTCERTYKQPLEVQVAALELFRSSGTQFDRYLSQIFVEKVLGMTNIFPNGGDSSETGM